MTGQKPRWGRNAVVLIAAAVVFLLAAGTFGTLWIIERNDHSAASEQLTGARTEAEQARTKLRDAESKRKAINDKLQETVGKERTQKQLRDKYANCAASGREFANFIRTLNEPAVDGAVTRIENTCF
jgi:uncharacterized protein (DUF3084 family)